MILDSLSNFHRYVTVHRLFPLVSEFIHSRSLLDLDTGKISLGNGITAAINEYATKSPEEKFIKCHRKFIDVQVMLSGAERIGFANRQQCAVLSPYDEENDVEKLTGPADFFTLRENDFAIFFPHDAHMPGLISAGGAGKVLKMVVKVPY